MAILHPDDFVASLARGDRIVSLDVGTKTIGLASAMWGQEVVIPHTTLVRRKFTQDADGLRAVMRDLHARALVVGWPLGLDGSFTKRCQSVQDFTRELDRFLHSEMPAKAGIHGPQLSLGLPGDVAITFFDERFSTHAGDAKINDPAAGLGRQRDDIIDALAAQVILEDFLNTYAS